MVPSWTVVMLKQRQYHLNFFTEQIVMTAFAEMNLSRWETFVMGLLNIRNKSFPFSLKWCIGPKGIKACASQ